jgi:hypothetical protein
MIFFILTEIQNICIKLDSINIYKYYSEHEKCSSRRGYMFSWIKRRASKGVNYGKKAVNYEQVKDNTETIKSMASSILSPKKTIENARQEKFSQARDRLGVSEADLIRIYKNYATMCYISLVFTALCFLGTLYNLFIAQKVMASTAMLALMAVCLMNSFKFSFRAFQIKHQKLCSVQEWWNRSNEWLPKL